MHSDLLELGVYYSYILIHINGFGFQSINSLCYPAAYCVVAVESVGTQTPIAFLERVKDEFEKRYRGGEAEAVAPKGLNKEFG